MTFVGDVRLRAPVFPVPSLFALRTQRIARAIVVVLGLVLVANYVMPFAIALRTPTPHRLASLSVPAFQFPVLHAPRPSSPARGAKAAPARLTPPARTVRVVDALTGWVSADARGRPTWRLVHRHLPVVVDRHTIALPPIAPAKHHAVTKTATPPEEVIDQVGTEPTMPDPVVAAAPPSAAPAADAVPEATAPAMDTPPDVANRREASMPVPDNLTASVPDVSTPGPTASEAITGPTQTAPSAAPSAPTPTLEMSDASTLAVAPAATVTTTVVLVPANDVALTSAPPVAPAADPTPVVAPATTAPGSAPVAPVITVESSLVAGQPAPVVGSSDPANIAPATTPVAAVVPATGGTVAVSDTSSVTVPTVAPPPVATPNADARGPPAGGTVVTVSGGTVSASDGSGSVSFAAGAVTGDVRVTVEQTGQTVTGLDQVSRVYDLHAFDAVTGAPVTNFASPPTLTITYDPRLSPVPPSIYYLDPTGTPQRLATLSFDPVAHTVTAALPHFSQYVLATPLHPATAANGRPPVVEATITGTVFLPALGGQRITRSEKRGSK